VIFRFKFLDFWSSFSVLDFFAHTRYNTMECNEMKETKDGISLIEINKAGFTIDKSVDSNPFKRAGG